MAAITLAKGKMYEYAVPIEEHIALPQDLDLQMQFPLALGSIGDFAAECISAALDQKFKKKTSPDDVLFAARLLQAYDESRLDESLSPLLRLISAAAYYLCDSPGNAIVQIKRIGADAFNGEPLSRAMLIALNRPWSHESNVAEPTKAETILEKLRTHYAQHAGAADSQIALASLREWAYSAGSARELLLTDLLCAVVVTKMERSARSLLPKLSGLTSFQWAPFLSRPESIKELWSSQRLLGEADLYRGESGIVQMPTSAGKSRAIELIIRSSFLSDRTRLALVVAPFRALCQEIASDLTKNFALDGYDVNQVSDTLQDDFSSDGLDFEVELKPRILVLTPEKLLYMIRQDAGIVKDMGLVIYDEGHQFDTGSRGVTYELLLTSIRRLLPPGAQTVLISAVIANATALANWLLGDQSRVVSSAQSSASRLVGFTSLPAGKDGQIQFRITSIADQTFFVPRVIIREEQGTIGRERKVRYFPTAESGSIALYLALRLIQNGGVAIFAGKKQSAAKIVRDAVQDVFRRGISLSPPAKHCNPKEIERFVRLFQENFGEDSYLTRAASLGMFAHHGSTPPGIRLAIEHAVREQHIHLIVCTSTLAQGVNLPIRYLLVTSAMQGREQVKARDFHNLMGRVGRAGMYGEGTVIFTNHKLYDERKSSTLRWEKALALVDPSAAEPTRSTLLTLLDPLRNVSGLSTIGTPSPSEFAVAIISNWDELVTSAENVPERLRANGFTPRFLVEQLESKRRITDAIEGFLMTNRTAPESGLFIENSRDLARQTFAYSLASDAQKDLLLMIFEAAAKKIEALVPSEEVQKRFAKSLLGIRESAEIDRWVRAKLGRLEQIDSEEELFNELWPLLKGLSTEKVFRTAGPATAMKALSDGWLAGLSFGKLLDELQQARASYPYGDSARSFDIDAVVDVCEQVFGFEFGLYLSAARDSFVAQTVSDSAETLVGLADSLQKRLKYGLPDQTCVSFYEAGFSDRVIVQQLSDSLLFEAAKNKSEARRLAREYRAEFAEILARYPSYFSEALISHAAQ